MLEETLAVYCTSGITQSRLFVLSTCFGNMFSIKFSYLDYNKTSIVFQSVKLASVVKCVWVCDKTRNRNQRSQNLKLLFVRKRRNSHHNKSEITKIRTKKIDNFEIKSRTHLKSLTFELQHLRNLNKRNKIWNNQRWNANKSGTSTNRTHKHA